MLQVYWKKFITVFWTHCNHIYLDVRTPIQLERMHFTPKLPLQKLSKAEVNAIISNQQNPRYYQHISYKICVRKLWNIYRLLGSFSLFVLSRPNNQRTYKTTSVPCFCPDFEHVNIGSVYCNISFLVIA